MAAASVNWFFRTDVQSLSDTMWIDLESLSPKQVYFTLIQTLVPRPIAWTLSENADGGLNLAPFSYFTAACSDPPLLMISVGRKPGGERKDTWVNIEQRDDFVVMIPHMDRLEDMNESSATLDAGISEVDELGLPTAPFEGSRLPRLADCRVAYACRRHQILEIGNGPQALIFGRVGALYLDDTVVHEDPRGRLKVSAERLEPVARLGAGEFAQLGPVHRLPRPL
jgi:flavin reductase (DIM6/NTAB) family NADH-FMN oxidoreductase RutF